MNPYGYPQSYWPTMPQPYPAVPQQQPSTPRTDISGRFVNSVDEVLPNEVAMDGSISVFPMRDYSSIFVKQWTPDGTIRTLEFVPKPVEKTVDDTSRSYFDERFAQLEKMIESVKKPVVKAAVKTS